MSDENVEEPTGLVFVLEGGREVPGRLVRVAASEWLAVVPGNVGGKITGVHLDALPPGAKVSYVMDDQQPQVPLETLAQALRLLDELAAGSPCRLDHNSNCQEHNWFPFDQAQVCADRRATEFLARYKELAAFAGGE